MSEKVVSDLMTADQAAEYMQVKPETLANWRCNGRYELPYTKLGARSVRYRKSEIDAFLERNTKRAA